MALDIRIDYPRVELIDGTSSTPVVNPYGMAIMLGAGTTTTNDKKLVVINDITDFSTKIGDTSVSKKYVEAFFENTDNAGVKLYFYKVNTGSTPAVAADYNTAIAGIDPTVNPGGIVISPEFFDTITVSADITSFTTALDNFCNTENESYWISIVDIPSTVTAMADAVTARNLITSNKGNLITYHPWYYKSAVKMLPSAAMAAICLTAWAGGRYNVPPAGIDFAIQGATALGYQLTKANLTTAHSSGINAIRSFPNYGILPYDTITLSNTVEFFQINSVVCFKIVFYLVQGVMFPFVHSSISGNVEVLAQAEAALNSVLNSAWTSGYLVGINQVDAYDVKASLETLPPPDNATLTFDVAVRPAYALQKVKVYIKNVLGL